MLIRMVPRNLIYLSVVGSRWNLEKYRFFSFDHLFNGSDFSFNGSLLAIIGKVNFSNQQDDYMTCNLLRIEQAG